MTTATMPPTDPIRELLRVLARALVTEMKTGGRPPEKETPRQVPRRQ
jgi:hypothetical protein